MFGWHRHEPERQKLPPRWTSDLWDELAGPTFPGHSFDVQLYIGIESLNVEFDFYSEFGESLDSASVKRLYNGFIGAKPGTRAALLRASVSFLANPEDASALSRLPEHSGGWGQTVNWQDRLPTLHLEVFASVESQRVFEDLFVRAKMFRVDHLPMSVWAKTQEPWWDIEDRTNVFARVFSINRVIFEQGLVLGTELR
jgi:hypothetical protein